MRVTDIPMILDLAVAAKEQGRKFVPCFTGDAGIGKSEICHQWAKEKGYKLLDLRLAYLENPDMVGLPFLREGRTVFATPDFWPTEGKWLILLDEMNRANASVLNTIMQLLTDFKVNAYSLPKEAIIAAVINPDTAHYDVATLDTALKDRIAEIPVFYDKNTFVTFMEKYDFDIRILSYIKSDVWVFRKPHEVGDKGKYIASRTWSRLNTALKAGADKNPDLLYSLVMSILGEAEGSQFFAYCTETKPVLYDDFLKDRNKSLATLKKYCSREDYRGDLLSASMTSFSENLTKLSRLDILDICENLTADLAFDLAKQGFIAEYSTKLRNGEKFDANEYLSSDKHTVKEKLKESMEKFRTKKEKTKDGSK